mmetsp:Transcript_49142/g.137600  ORF Transcript_49142/g.137600 Transcript_49142/m.137600 type:complete len:266 (+) Transcript_49142:1198-1995(+)
MTLKSASGPSCFSAWWQRMSLTAVARKPSNSCASFLPTSERNFTTCASDLEIWPSRRVACADNFWDSAARRLFSSGSGSSFNASMSSRALATDAFASLASASTSSARGVISVDFMDLTLEAKGPAWASSFLTSSLASDSLLDASSALFFSCSFFSWIAFSLLTRSSLRFVSRVFSRAMPTKALNLGKASKATPRLPSSDRTRRMKSKSATGTLKVNSPLANACSSFLLSMPSPSLSYFWKVVFIEPSLDLATSFFVTLALFATTV